MPSPQGPLLPRRRLGAELRRLRGERTLDDVAAETLISTSKLSRLENGQGVPQPRDIRDLITYYGADRATSERIRRWAADGRRQAWWKEYSDVMRDSADMLFDYESGASAIRICSPTILPGLLQTETYARRLITTLYANFDADQVEKLVQVRLRRQNILFNDAEDASHLQAVIDEAAVLRARATGSEDEARAQLIHLHEISLRRNISIRILPLSEGLHAGVMGLFEIYRFSADIDRDIVHVETHSGDRFLEEQSSVLEYLHLFDVVSRRALNNTQSRDLLTRLVEAPREEGD
jgi:transcriptional regulator with XRE-family HTH domain